MRSPLFFEFGDKAGEANFIAWHQQRHHTYDLIQSRKGNSLPYLDLTGEINSDWAHRHAVRHATHRRLMGNTKISHAVGLSTIDWHDETQRTGWLFQHALDHQALDKFYGL